MIYNIKIYIKKASQALLIVEEIKSRLLETFYDFIDVFIYIKAIKLPLYKPNIDYKIEFISNNILRI